MEGVLNYEESDNTERTLADALRYEEVHGEIPDWQTLMILQDEQKRVDGFVQGAVA